MSDFASSLLVNSELAQIGILFGSRQNWEAKNHFQELILRHEPDALAIASALTPAQLLNKAAHDHETINAFLRANGFGEIQLDNLGSGPDMAYAAAIMKLLGKWLQSGDTGYKLPENHKPAFRFSAHNGLTHFLSSGQRLVRIQTDSGFDMWLAEQVKTSGFDMIDIWIKIINQSRVSAGNGAVLPYVKIDSAKVDIKALIGMRAGNTVIQQALAAAKFKLTNHEVNFEMAVAIGAKRMAMEIGRPEPGDFVVGNKLHFALVRRQLPLMPLAVGTVTASEFSETSDIM